MATPSFGKNPKLLRLKLISCEILFREICHAATRSPHTVDTEFLPKGLHDIGCTGMRERLQTAIDRVDTGSYDAILLGYGLCNNGIDGLCARDLPIVVPRAHDCITLFFGDRERYLDYFHNNPGTYFLTTGWIERGEATGELRQLSIERATGMDSTYEELVAKYGEDNARFLYDQLCDMTKHYTKIAFVEMGVEPNDSYRRYAEETARSREWQFEAIRGDMRLLHLLADGEWPERDFLVVEPGHRITVSHDALIIGSETDRK